MLYFLFFKYLCASSYVSIVLFMAGKQNVRNSKSQCIEKKTKESHRKFYEREGEKLSLQVNWTSILRLTNATEQECISNLP